MYPFAYSLNKYLLTIYYVPITTVLRAKGIKESENKTKTKSQLNKNYLPVLDLINLEKERY